MSIKKDDKINSINLEDHVIIETIRKLLEAKTNNDEFFARLDEAQSPNQKFLRETEFTI